MKKPNYIEVEANTVKEAIQKAAEILACKRKDIEIKVLAEGQRGLFNMSGAKPARIKARLKTRPSQPA